MATTTAIAIFFLIWWLTLFVVLPWGVSSQYEEGAPGTDPGAPRVHNIAMKLVWTTVVSAIIFAVLALIHAKGWITLDDLAALIGVPG
jgi:predicted secreted protein